MQLFLLVFLSLGVACISVPENDSETSSTDPNPVFLEVADAGIEPEPESVEEPEPVEEPESVEEPEPVEEPLSNPPFKITFYEGNSGDQDVVCQFVNLPSGVTQAWLKGKVTHGCANDEIRSVVFSDAPRGTVVEVWDREDCNGEDDDSAWVQVTQYAPEIVVRSFEGSAVYDNYRLRRWGNGNLDGKISCLKITVP